MMRSLVCPEQILRGLEIIIWTNSDEFGNDEDSSRTTVAGFSDGIFRGLSRIGFFWWRESCCEFSDVEDADTFEA
jgi:hypothetical protein